MKLNSRHTHREGTSNNKNTDQGGWKEFDTGGTQSSGSGEVKYFKSSYCITRQHHRQHNLPPSVPSFLPFFYMGCRLLHQCLPLKSELWCLYLKCLIKSILKLAWTRARDSAHSTKWTGFSWSGIASTLRDSQREGVRFSLTWSLIGRCLFKFNPHEQSLQCQGVFCLLWSVCVERSLAKWDNWNPKMSPQAVK